MSYATEPCTRIVYLKPGTKTRVGSGAFRYNMLCDEHGEVMLVQLTNPEKENPR